MALRVWFPVGARVAAGVGVGVAVGWDGRGVAVGAGVALGVVVGFAAVVGAPVGVTVGRTDADTAGLHVVRDVLLGDAAAPARPACPAGVQVPTAPQPVSSSRAAAAAAAPDRATGIREVPTPAPFAPTTSLLGQGDPPIRRLRQSTRRP